MVVDLVVFLQGFAKLYGGGGGVGEGEIALGTRVQLPCVYPLYIGVEGAYFFHWGVGKGGRKEIPSFPFPTDCYPPFLGILILSLRYMILFLLRGDLGEP